MKTTPIDEYGHQLTVLGLVNAYLVREDDGFTLIDAMVGDSSAKILALAESLGAPVQRILLTHAHADHVGNVDALAAKLPGIPLAIGRRESLMLPKPPAQDLRLQPGEDGKALMRMNFPGIATPATHLIAEGELFGSLRCIPTPGHTVGHFSYLDERDGTLYTGDAMITIGGSPHIPGFGPWYFPFPKLATWNRDVSVTSIRNLLDLPIQRLAPGHGRILEGGRNLLEAALAEAR
jgi:glyoxylase-like metal-dependent hydrolase (beta-lactamase superfamily II)